MERRKLDIAVISDVHLGTYQCHAVELLNYLKSIKPDTLILNGDFIDAGHRKRSHFPKNHLEVISEVIKMSISGTKVYYITDNRDDVLRRFSEFSGNNFSLRDKLVLQLGNKKYWVFHGDIFDASTRISPVAARLGGLGYDFLLWFNRWINNWRKRFGKERMSFSQKVKTSVKKAVLMVEKFEKTAIRLAAEQQYDYVICGHIHQPVIKNEIAKEQQVTYMNSGDWVENLTALEYVYGTWSIYRYDELDFAFINPRLYVKNNKKEQKQASYSRKKRTEQIIEKILDSNLQQKTATKKTNHGTSDLR